MVTPFVEQGDLLRVGGIKWPVIVVSNNFFNESGRVVACPILPDAVEGPLHIRLKDCPVEGYVLCEQMRYIDLKVSSVTLCAARIVTLFAGKNGAGRAA